MITIPNFSLYIDKARSLNAPALTVNDYYSCIYNEDGACNPYKRGVQQLKEAYPENTVYYNKLYPQYSEPLTIR